MADYRRYFDKDFLGSWDLQSEDGRALNAVVTIAKVDQGELQVVGKNKKKRAPVLSFVGKKKKLVLNATNGATIAEMYGFDTRAWVGKKIVLYPTTTKFGKKVVPCIRVRPQPPAANARDTADALEIPVTLTAEMGRDADAPEPATTPAAGPRDDFDTDVRGEWEDTRA